MPDNDTSEYNIIIQTESELLNDLNIIKNYFPNKLIIFQCHFRPNIIYDDETKTITKREIIYNVLLKFCNENKDCILYDPSSLIKSNHNLFDGDTHFTDLGYVENFNIIYDNFLANVNF